MKTNSLWPMVAAFASILFSFGASASQIGVQTPAGYVMVPVTEQLSHDLLPRLKMAAKKKGGALVVGSDMVISDGLGNAVAYMGLANGKLCTVTASKFNGSVDQNGWIYNLASYLSKLFSV